MNVYDFDKTIYDGDSATDFYIYLLKKYPKLWLNIPTIIYGFLGHYVASKSKTWMKEKFYAGFKYIPDVNKEIKLFWDINIDKIFPYYLVQQKEDDIIISASPLFDIKEICDRLGIKTYLASNVDPKTGKYDGENCWGEEKVKRLKEIIPNPKVDNFYSDSLSDTPLALLANQAYIIKKGQVLDWPKGDK